LGLRGGAPNAARAQPPQHPDERAKLPGEIADATIHGVAGAWFGWAAVAAAAFIGYLQQRLNLVKEIGEAPGWFLPVAGAFVALVAALFIHAVVIAPYRAWRMLNPFKTKILSGILKSEYPTETVERQRAAVLIENKPYRQRSNCVLHVQTVSNFDDQYHAFPRFIKEFSIQSGETQQIEFLTWTARKAPLENDKTMTFCGPVAWGWGGNFVALPCGSYDMEIRIGVPDDDATRIFCRVWIEGDELKAAKMEVGL
jgi:hypothetical protein